MLKTIMIRSALIAFTFAISVAAHAYASDPKQFDVPPGDLSAALHALAKQSGVEFVYQTKQLKGLRTKGINGTFTAEEAITKLLDGTPLTFRTDASGAMLIALPKVPLSTLGEGEGPAERNGEASPGAAATPDLARKARSWNRLHLAQDNQPSSSAASGSRTREQELRESPLSDSDGQMGEVVVTGSRLRRPETDGPSQVIAIDRAQIERRGATTVREALQLVTQNSYAGDESPNAGTLGGASNVRLRGLPSRATLVLINGRRVAASAIGQSFFDLNSLPLAAIERIEVLADSASAIYGGDAIAGAVNFILRSDFEGLAFDLGAGSSYKDDAGEKRMGIALGGSGDRFSGLLAVEHFERDLMTRDARENSASTDFRDVGGTDFRTVAPYPATVWALPGQGNLPGLNSRFAGVPSGQDGTNLVPSDFATTEGVRNTFEVAPSTTVVPDASRTGLLGKISYDLTDSTRIFAETIFSSGEQTLYFEPARLTGGSVGSFVVPASNPFNPFGTSVAVEYRLVELGPVVQPFYTDFYRVLAGLEGSLGKSSSWELTYLSDKSRGTQQVLNQANTAAVRTALTSSNPATALNVFSALPNNSAAVLGAIRLDTASRREISAQMIEGLFRGNAFSFPAGAISYAAGFDLRRESGDTLNSNITIAGVTTVIAAERDIVAAFAEVEIPVVSPAMDIPAISELRLSGAARYDDYSDFGTSTNPQVGLIWRPFPTLLVRGSWGTSFRPPNFVDLLTPRTVVPVPVTDPARDNEAVIVSHTTGGNPNLEPEEGDSLSYGFIWQPRNFSIGGTAYRVKLTDAIQSALAASQLLANADTFADRITRGFPIPGDPRPGPLLATDGSQYNFGSITVEGVDALISYDLSSGKSEGLALSLAGSYIDRYDVQLALGQPSRNEVGRSNFGGAPPRFKATSSATWRGLGGWGAALSVRYIGERTDYVDSSVVNSGRTLGDEWVFDLQGSYNFADLGVLESLRINAGVTNLTNEQGDRANNFVGWDAYQSDLRGRFYYLKLSMKL